MKDKIQVLIVEDSILVRKQLTEIINSDPELEVCATAPNGKIALGKIHYFNPDIMTIDLEMPEMNGKELLYQVKKNYSDLPVIVVSSTTYSGASDTLDCLNLGASDFITKPEGISEKKEITAYLTDTLNPKLKFFGKKSNSSIDISLQYISKLDYTKIEHPSRNFEIVCIGISTGGTTALMKLIPSLPKNFPLPILIVIHTPPVFSKTFADRLNESSFLEVVEAMNGEKIESGKVYIAPGDYHLTLHKTDKDILVKLNKEEKVNFCRPSVDVFFESASLIFKETMLGIVMTGMGTDGLNGARVVKENNGYIVVQDAETSTVWGMPGSISKSGLADLVLSIQDISDFLNGLIFANK